jgi:hypothetical protein
MGSGYKTLQMVHHDASPAAARTARVVTHMHAALVPTRT